MKLYLIAGYAKTGKDYFAQCLKEEWEKRKMRVCILKISSPLYHYAYEHFGWNGKEEDKPRSFLQHMGIEYIKEELEMPDFLLTRLKEDIYILDKFFDIGIITDGRLKTEIDDLKKTYPTLVTIHIKREKYENGLTEQEENHITEKDLEGILEFDFEIVNQKEADLEKEASNIVRKGMKNL